MILRGSAKCAVAVGAVLAIAACSNASTALQQSGLPPAASAAQVLTAVKEAQTATSLPESVTPRLIQASANDDVSLWAIDGCNPPFETRSLDDLRPCTVGAPAGAQTMIVIGDSATFMWSQGLDLIGKQKDWRIIILGKDNCGPAALTYYQYQLKRDLVECNDWQKWRMDQIHTIKPAAVLLTGWYGGNTGPNHQLTPEIWRDALIRTIEQIPRRTKSALLGNFPHFEVSAADCLAQHMSDISKCAAPPGDKESTEGNTGYRQAAAATKSLFVDVIPWFCDQKCPAVIAGYLPYAGKYHITHDYAKYLSNVLAEALQPVMT